MRRWFGRKRQQNRLDREIESHLELEAEDLQERGFSPGDAVLGARRKPIRWPVYARTDLHLERSALKVVGHFGADASECGVNFAGTAESGLDVRKDVFRADLLDEIGFLEQARGLIAGAA